MNQMAALLFFGFIATIIFVVIAAVSKQRSDAIKASFRLLAARYGGTHYPGTAFGFPSARFVYHGAHVLVDIYSTGGKHKKYYTQFHISWPNPSLRCRVFPERFFNLIGKFFGMEDHVIGSPRFDADYVINGNDVQAIKAFLAPTVQLKINELRWFGGNDDLYVSIQGGVLLIKKRGLIRESSSLAQFVGHCLTLFDEAMGGVAEGIEFVERPASEPKSPLTGDVICQICGDTIVVDIVLCRSCKTPHHDDCWQYYGACSTYGCGERSFVRQLDV